ncbi:MAG: 4-(cytidine 5'-diphospho)-2-C-methyl-D-erythritol kinase [Planctomycetaceae bacterium]
MLQQLTVRSPSKINVFLEVLGKRPDGFHDLETVMLRTQFTDVMRFCNTESNSVSLSVATGTDVRLAKAFPRDESNLILRAAKALREHYGVNQGAAITIAKRIPPESGLGGGSGNAATTLLALNRLWKLNLPLSELHRLAETLGSDVNFLLSGFRAAICRGRGESVEQISLGGRFYFVSVRPRSGNRTSDVFQGVSEFGQFRSANEIVEKFRGGFSRRFAITPFNRLTESAAAQNDDLADLLRRASDILNVQMYMSGSGSSCFIPVGSHRDAVRMANRTKMVTGLLPQILWA